jgi:HTH-type transcriptional regulator/antitoxin MqsA
MNMHTCPSCGHSSLHAIEVFEDLLFRGIDLSVRASKTQCQDCGYAFESDDQQEANLDAARVAFKAESTAARAAKGLLNGKEIRAIREQMGLTQKEAAELLGGGPVAFSKYENNEIMQSVAMDRLLRLLRHGGKKVVEDLKTALGQNQQERGTKKPFAFTSAGLGSRVVRFVAGHALKEAPPLVEASAEGTSQPIWFGSESVATSVPTRH